RFVRHVRRQREGVLRRRRVHDQRVEPRPPLQLKHPRHRRGVHRVRRQPVHRLRRHPHHAPAAQQRRRLIQLIRPKHRHTRVYPNPPPRPPPTPLPPIIPIP